jgi:apolipoprotein D and lipocalin family protein
VVLSRYTGHWFEIAKIPNRFQKQCAGGTTAEYRLRDDGRIDVVNRCTRADGSVDEAHGIARVADTATNAKLEVSFVRFLWRSWFWGDYWVIGLDDDYAWAIVGHPERKYGWILSRTPSLDDATIDTIFGALRAQGYNPAAFEMTPQPVPAPR